MIKIQYFVAINLNLDSKSNIFSQLYHKFMPKIILFNVKIGNKLHHFWLLSAEEIDQKVTFGVPIGKSP